MKRKLLTIFLLSVVSAANAQLQIYTFMTPAELVSTLCPIATQISNIKFNGSTANAHVVRDQASLFLTSNPTNLGMTQGLILSSGKTSIAPGPNNLGNATSPSASFSTVADPDLAMLTTNTVQNHAVVEFDFLANGDRLNMTFIFASEEYPEFSNTGFNDVMGIFLSGPGIGGPFTNNAKNIALIPNTTVPIRINTVNNGLTNNGPCVNCAYYVNNGTGTTPTLHSGIQYDGFTTPVVANAELIPGQIYHIKLAVGNVGDNSFESAVFFKANSFSTGESIACEPQDLCMYTFTLTDNGGDGLNGELMTVYQNGNAAAFLYDLSNSTNQTFEFEVPLCHDVPFELYWNAGGLHPEQTGLTIYNPFNQIIYNKPPGDEMQQSTLYSGVANCFYEMSTDKFETMAWWLTPNPAKDEFEIVLSNTGQKLRNVRILDAVGKVVLTQPGLAGHPIAVGQLASGMYVVEIETDDAHTGIKKLVIE